MDPNVGGILGQSQREMASSFNGQHTTMKQLKIEVVEMVERKGRRETDV